MKGHTKNYNINGDTLTITSQEINVLSKVLNIELKKNNNITTIKFQQLGTIETSFLEKLFKIEKLKENIRKLDFSNEINSRNPNTFNEETLRHLFGELDNTILELDLSNIEIIDLKNINIFRLIDESNLSDITIKLCDIEEIKLNQENYKIIQRLKNEKSITIWLNHTSEQIQKIIQSIQNISV